MGKEGKGNGEPDTNKRKYNPDTQKREQGRRIVQESDRNDGRKR